MPYLVITKQEDAHPYAKFTILYRRAVATLEEARVAANRECYKRGYSTMEANHCALPGTVGPLPDGTVIEIERVELRNLARQAGVLWRGALYMSESEVLDTFNARDGTAH